MSCIECLCEMCDLQIFYFFVRVYFDEEKPAFDRFSLVEFITYCMFMMLGFVIQVRIYTF